MYYITKKVSETGKKFQAVLALKDKAEQAQKALSEKYGFTQYRPCRFTVWGGFSSCVFKIKPEGKVWKAITLEEYMPDNRTKIGKGIQAEFDAMPSVSNEELNSVIGFDSFFSTIGCQWNNGEYFGFSIFEKWGITMPDDCEEVTTKRYKELFPSQE